MAGAAGSLRIDSRLVHGATLELQGRLIVLLREQTLSAGVVAGRALTTGGLDVRGVIERHVLGFALEDNRFGRRLRVSGEDHQCAYERKRDQKDNYIAYTHDQNIYPLH